jgi:hypothetical protein
MLIVYLLVVSGNCFLPALLFDLLAVFEEFAGVFVVEVLRVAG